MLRIGMNLEQLVSEGPEQPFCDQMHQAREWQAQPAPMPAMDANGWPLSLAPGQRLQTLLMWNIQTNLHYPAGNYDVIYDGVGHMIYQQSTTQGQFAVPIVSSVPGHDVITLDPAHGGLQIAITSTDPANHLRNVQVWRPGGDRRHFNQDFIATLADYGALRFMWWNHATINRPGNAPFQTSWAGRPQVSSRTWANDNGVPMEAMLELANGVGIDPWFCVSHLADDDYIRQMATLIHTLLASNRNVYIESSNEVWNGAYQQGVYANQQGALLWPSVSQREANARWNAQRAVHVFQLMRPIIGGRMRRVLGSFTDQTAYTNYMLTFGSTATEVDMVAIAPYFGFPSGLTTGTTLDQLFAALPTQVDATLAFCSAQKAACDAHSLPLIAYEGGPSFASNQSTPIDIDALYTAANRDSRMGTAIRRLLDGWKALNAGIFVYYSNTGYYSRFGRYSVLEYMTQLGASPKYAALHSWMTDNP